MLYIRPASVLVQEAHDLSGDEVEHLRDSRHNALPHIVEHRLAGIDRGAQRRRPAAQGVHDIAQRSQSVDRAGPLMRRVRAPARSAALSTCCMAFFVEDPGRNVPPTATI